ncbi:MAG: hypothetical protein M3N22_07545 [Acidobacteriota bacterium]|nr:hypothetical protein [Acidobacteriota bacterium]
MLKTKFAAILICIFTFGSANAAAQSTIRINAGGSGYTDSKGQFWSADQGFNTGALSACALEATVTGRAILSSISNLSHQLYHSNQAGSRDHFGDGNKFVTPMIAKGHVYIGTPTGIAIFGLL